MNKPEVLPVSILVTSYNRLNFLERTINAINERTFYPFRIIVVDNNSTDGSVGYLKNAKVTGKIFDHIFLPQNIGQSQALNQGFAAIEKWETELRRPSNDFFVTTNDDLLPPDLGQECWLTRMVVTLERHEPEYGGLCMRIQRTPRNEIDEFQEIIPCFKGFPSVFRIMRRSDFRTLGDRPFGRLLKWDSNTAGDTFKIDIRKKFGFTTHIYADHIGFIRNKGYADDVQTFTVAENKVNIHEEKPYPEIDSKTNIPVKINHQTDNYEQKKREEYDAVLAGKRVGPEATLLVLTCKRPEGLKRIIEGIKKTCGKADYKVLVVADNDDTEAYEFCLENGITCILSSQNRDFVSQANLAVSACDTPYFVVLADDMSLEQAGWLEEALRLYKERFPDNIGLMAFNDGIQNGRLFATGMSSKKFVYTVGGYLYYPRFKHFGGDNVVSFLAKEMGCYYYAETVKVVHHHPTNKAEGLANETDATYKKSEMFFSFDQQLKKTKKNNVELLLKERNYCDYL